MYLKKIILYAICALFFSELSLVSAMETGEEEKLQKVQEENFEKLKKLTSSLSKEADELRWHIRPLTGTIFVISFSEEYLQPSIISRLSATVLKGGKVLTAFHALIPLLEHAGKNKERILLFFIPSKSIFKNEDDHDIWDFNLINEPITLDEDIEFWNKLSHDTYILPTSHLSGHSLSVSQHHKIKEFNLSSFLLSIQKKLREAKEKQNLHQHSTHSHDLFSDNGNIQLPTNEEIEVFGNTMIDDNVFFLVKTMTNPIYGKHQQEKSIYILPSNFEKIDPRNDIAVCEVTHSALLPDSFLSLLVFNQDNIDDIIKPKNAVNIFIASSRKEIDFFTGGHPQKKTSDIKLTPERTLDVPIPQIKGCSGGALIIAPKTNNKYDLSKIRVVGVVSLVPTKKPENWSVFCFWKG